MEARTKLLVIEDDGEIRKVLRLTFASSGQFDIHEASNGDDGLRMIREWRPDIVLLDLMMPGGISGIEVCMETKNDPALKGTYIIILSALGQRQDLLATESAGADNHVVKPFSPLELLGKVAQVAASLKRG